ncbi:hypothetical protein [Bradyrhizobium sp. CCBAU 45384]|uniref:hypothetical protein n=1 Tax=Bradyrhizobium sp. CCBAU 45384 TaxID=858428 RepID=UPI002304F787|nr:hypothetical protein [Bradyrhizobium sp. CCBAU 45384]MDA9410991.1 hypothetical protein [Bradyrhizobium sp. CCBAU 45384]
MSRSASDVPSSHSVIAIDRRHLLQGVAITGLAAAGNAFLAPAVQANIWEEGEAQCHVSAPEQALGDDLDDLLADFMKVSRTLTGMPLALLHDIRLGREYLVRFAKLNVPAIDVRKLIAANAETADAIMNNKDIRAAAEQLIYLWYLSAFFLNTTVGPAWVYGTTDQYEQGIIWKVIGAHAPMMPMKPFQPNYWAKAPRLA